MLCRHIPALPHAAYGALSFAIARRPLHDGLIKLHPEVSEAIANQKAVVALESTIITHGMPYPHNLNTAKEVEQIVKEHGAVPATIGIVKGKIHVGVTETDLQYLAETKDMLKVSRRDLPYILSKGLSGGTTVSATVLVAHKVGIPLFVTGGVGGVHRDGQNTNAQKFGQDSGVLIAVPVPEEQAASSLLIEDAIQQAVAEARDNGILGKDVTPFILDRIYKLTQGISLTTNIALIKNNAKVGSRIACALARQNYHKYSTLSQPPRGKHSAPAQPVVIGGCNVDYIAKVKQGDMVFGGPTNRGTVRQSLGGVGRNLADCLSRLGLNPLFISAIGSDANGDAVLRICSHMDTGAIAMLPEHSTAVYCAVITATGELSLGLGDMDIHRQITEQYVSKFVEQLQSASFVCLDGNIPTSTINYVCSVAKEHKVPVLFEPTDITNACKPFETDSWKALAYTTPNLMELRAMNEALGLPVPAELPSVIDDVIGVALDMSRPLLEHLQCAIVTLGQHGVLLCGRSEKGTISLQPKKAPQSVPGKICGIYYPAIAAEAEEILNVSGTGDRSSYFPLRLDLPPRCGPSPAAADSRLDQTDSSAGRRTLTRVARQRTSVGSPQRYSLPAGGRPPPNSLGGETAQKTRRQRVERDGEIDNEEIQPVQSWNCPQLQKRAARWWEKRASGKGEMKGKKENERNVCHKQKIKQYN
uniref:uncharacterized protein isoform X7 n=1 Tax=Pristiophorus japonicus TaxID=55135 RepID=UPI00398F5D53